MRINKFISYILCNKGIIINLHKLHFLSFPFFSPTKQKSFLSFHFSTPPTKHNIFHSLTFLSSHNFSSSHFSTPPSKRSVKEKSDKCGLFGGQKIVLFLPRRITAEVLDHLWSKCRTVDEFLTSKFQSLSFSICFFVLNFCWINP